MFMYCWLFAAKHETVRKVLEIGIHRGGSIRLWNNYLHQADIFGVDLAVLGGVWSRIKGVPRIHLFPNQNAYSASFIQCTFQNGSLDIMVDDGLHSLVSMQQMIQLYLPLLRPDGILVIEDIQSPAWIQGLRPVTPAIDRPFIDTNDLRQIRGCSDDILFVINWGVNATTPGEMPGLLDNTISDKNPAHSCTRTYQSLFYGKTATAKNVMEIGISAGGSIRLRYDYFLNNQISVLDIMRQEKIWSKLRNIGRITLLQGGMDITNHS
jgi:hypothetical protein